MKRKFLVLPLLLLFAASCATVPVKPFSQMTPKEKSTFFMETYNRIYDDTLSMAKMPNLTEGQKVVVRKKKEILTKVKPLIELYDLVAAGGGIPSPENEAAILNFINQLATVGG